MTNLQRAIVFIEQGRDLIEEAAGFEGDSTYQQDLNELADDLGNALAKLESFVKPNKE